MNLRFLVLLVVLQLTPTQIALDQIKALVDALVTTLATPPRVPAITTAEGVDAALAAAAPGAVLPLDPTLVYSKPLTLRQAVTLASTALVTGRMTVDAPAPSFRGGITIAGPNITLVGIEVRHPDPQHSIVDIEAAASATVLDRVRVLGDPITGGRHGIAANGSGVILRQSYVADCFRTYPGDDSQAFLSWSSPGPFLLEDNYLSGGSETVLFGGADPISADRIPSDIVMRQNRITKNPAWQTQRIGVKNTLELKNARRVLIEDNDIEYSWGGHGQTGYLLMLTPRNAGVGDSAPYSTVEDVEIRNNRFAHAAAALSILGSDNTGVSQRVARLNIHHNVFVDLDPVTYAGSKQLILIQRGPTTTTIAHNTFRGVNLTAVVYFGALPPAEDLIITNNTWPTTRYGVFGGSVAVGPAAWATYVLRGTLSGNVVTP